MTSSTLRICKVVAEEFGISLDALLSRERRYPEVWARQIAMMIAAEVQCGGLCFAAREFGRDHGTVFCARRKVKTMTNRFAWEFEAVDRIRQKLKLPTIGKVEQNGSH